jgi:hypothetical protein
MEMVGSRYGLASQLPGLQTRVTRGWVDVRRGREPLTKTPMADRGFRLLSRFNAVRRAVVVGVDRDLPASQVAVPIRSGSIQRLTRPSKPFPNDLQLIEKHEQKEAQE